MFKWIRTLVHYLRTRRFNREMFRYFDWPLFLLVIAISLFSVACIFSATTTSVTEEPATIMEMLETQPTSFARLQFFWLLAGIVAMFAVMYFSYEAYGRYARWIFIGNLAILVFVLGTEAGRGGMTAFFQWGQNRTFQPSELGKVAIIISLAKLLAARKTPISTVRELVAFGMHVAVPVVLIVAQPDFGTALVYLAIFCVLVLVSGTNYKLILGALAVVVLVAIPGWYLLNSIGSFRLTRILMWLHPEDYPDDARQVINAQIAIGSGGMWGKGIVSVGSFASLGYISDDHTDFIFAIVCESFGFVGGFSLVLAYVLLLLHLARLAVKVEDPLGSYIISGVLAMYLFHIVENICMVLGLLPVTGIPLPFMSYGGSNMLTNMMGLGLVMNVVMRDRQKKNQLRETPARASRI